MWPINKGLMKTFYWLNIVQSLKHYKVLRRIMTFSQNQKCVAMILMIMLVIVQGECNAQSQDFKLNKGDESWCILKCSLVCHFAEDVNAFEADCRKTKCWHNIEKVPCIMKVFFLFLLYFLFNFFLTNKCILTCLYFVGACALKSCINNNKYFVFFTRNDI